MLDDNHFRQTCKEDMFKWTVTGLIKKTETVLKQNNTMNIEEIYFENHKKTAEGGSSMVIIILKHRKMQFPKHDCFSP